MSPPGTRPTLRVVRGEPTPEEVAALVAVVAAHAATGEPATPPPAGGWSNRAALLRRPVWPRPGAWRASARTR